MKETIFVVLQLQENQELYTEFRQLPAKQQIDFICENITKTINELRRKHGNIPIVFTWREAAICNEKLKFLDKNLKKYFKDSFKNITGKHKNVTILAGPINTIKTYEKPHEKANKLEQVRSYYAHYENIFHSDQDQKSFYTQVRMINNKEELPDKLEISRVTGYCFEDGKCFHRHDKVTPYKDDLNLENERSVQYSIFQPSNKKNNSSILPLDESTKIGFETCREHKFKVLKHEVEKTKASIFAQFVLSDGASIFEDNLCGKYVLLVDSNLKTELIDVRPDLPSNIQLHCYSKDPFTNEMTSLNAVTLDQATCVVPRPLIAILEDDLIKFKEVLKTSDPALINKPFQGFHLLTYSIRNGKKDMALLLLDANASPNVIDVDGQTPLGCAIAANNIKLVEILLAKGADPNQIVMDSTPLSWAIEFDNEEIINLLIKYKASIMPNSVSSIVNHLT